MRPCVIVTRPAAQAAEWVQALRVGGLQAQALPLIHIASAPDPSAVQQAWARLHGFSLVMFVSANAVEQFFALRPASIAGRWPDTLCVGSTGQGTTSALLAKGVPSQAIFQPSPGEPSESEALWRQIEHRPWAGQRVLVVRGEDGRDWLARQFEQAGATPVFLAAYCRQPPTLNLAQAELLAQALKAPSRFIWLFSSSEAVRHLHALAPEVDWAPSLAVATHYRIAEAAREVGFAQVSISEPRIDAVRARCTHLEFGAP